MTRIGALVIGAWLLAGCSADRSLLPRMPQVEQAQELLQHPGDRMNRHSECRKSARRAEELVTCMQAGGYEFIPRTLDYPSPECWRLRDIEDDRDPALPQAFCFLRRRE